MGKRLFVLWAIGALSMTSLAQDSTRVLPSAWSLQQCLDYAKENNIQINSLRLAREINEQERLLSRSAVLPDLYGSASQNFSHSGINGSGVSGSYGLSSSWTLFRGGFLRTDIEQKALVVDASNYDILTGENDITLQITRAYLNILLDKEAVIYNTDLLNTSRSQVEQIRRQYEVGTVARKDVAQFEAQLANDQYLLTASRNAERQDKLVLKQLLQLPGGSDFDVVKPDTIIQSQVITPLPEATRMAFETRPEIKSSRLGVQISELDLRKAQSGYAPTVSLGAGINSGYANGSGFGLWQQFDRNFSQQVGVTLSVPLFTRRLNRTNVAQAKIGVEQAKLSLRDVSTTLSQSVEQSYINILNANDQLNASAEQLKYNQEVFRISNQELKIGVVNLVAFYQQRNLYVQSLQNYIQAKYNAALSAKIYEFYAGVPVKL